MNNTWQEIVAQFDLEGHVEGGFFRRIYCSDSVIDTENGQRPTMTSIYYLLTAEQPYGSLHINRSDIVHYFLQGGELEYHLYDPDKKDYRKVILSPDNPTLTVPGGVWKASKLLNGHFGLITEAVTPGFVYEDMELVSKQKIDHHCPELISDLKNFIHPQSEESGQ